VAGVSPPTSVYNIAGNWVFSKTVVGT